MNPQFTRNMGFPGKIVLLDGISGTGKTMISRILDTYTMNHVPKFSYAFEQICIAAYESKIEKDAAISLLRLQADQLKYDMHIGREVNFRPRDLSSVFKSSKKIAYLVRAISKDGPDVVENLFLKRMNVVIISHQLLKATEILDLAFNDSFINIHTVRNPLYLFNHWASYVNVQCSSPRDFTVWKQEAGNTIPWFFTNKENYSQYENLSTGDKTIVCLIELINQALEHHFIWKNKSNYICLEFEKFVLNPKPVISNLDKILGDKSIKDVLRVQKEERIPRDHISDSKKMAIYSRYGDRGRLYNMNHKDEYKKRMDQVKELTSENYFNKFKDLIARYENEFETWF